MIRQHGKYATLLLCQQRRISTESNVLVSHPAYLNEDARHYCVGFTFDLLLSLPKQASIRCSVSESSAASSF